MAMAQRRQKWRSGRLPVPHHGQGVPPSSPSSAPGVRTRGRAASGRPGSTAGTDGVTAARGSGSATGTSRALARSVAEACDCVPWPMPGSAPGSSAARSSGVRHGDRAVRRFGAGTVRRRWRRGGQDRCRRGVEVGGAPFRGRFRRFRRARTGWAVPWRRGFGMTTAGVRCTGGVATARVPTEHRTAAVAERLAGARLRAALGAGRHPSPGRVGADGPAELASPTAVGGQVRARSPRGADGPAGFGGPFRARGQVRVGSPDGLRSPVRAEVRSAPEPCSAPEFTPGSEVPPDSEVRSAPGVGVLTCRGSFPLRSPGPCRACGRAGRRRRGRPAGSGPPGSGRAGSGDVQSRAASPGTGPSGRAVQPRRRSR